jgi:hypothetical protein
MRTSIILLFIIGTLNSWAQIITDDLTPERDKIFYELECGSNNYFLKRVLTIGESASIRKGRELLVIIDEQANVIFEFEDIDNYSSLFFEVAEFNLYDINSDGTKELIIEIFPWESSNIIWIYQIKIGCTPKFIASLTVDEFKIVSNKLVTKKNTICTYFGECLIYEDILGLIDFERLTRVDFYSLREGQLINSNFEHRKAINECISDYQIVLDQLAELKSKSEDMFEREYITEIEDRLKQIIEEY